LADKALVFPLRKKWKKRNGTRTSAAQKPAQSLRTTFPDLILFFAQNCRLLQHTCGGLHARNVGTKTGTVIPLISQGAEAVGRGVAAGLIAIDTAGKELRGPKPAYRRGGTARR
jgi:hypothetical protein